MKNGIKVIYVRSNELVDIYKITGNGFDEYIERPRNQGHNEETILDELAA